MSLRGGFLSEGLAQGFALHGLTSGRGADADIRRALGLAPALFGCKIL
jgi:hypothetical protein